MVIRFLPLTVFGAMIVLRCLSLEGRQEHKESTALVKTVAPRKYGEQRIVGGTDAKIGEFPYMVSIMVDNRHICGGTLYTPLLVLTAAHCCYYKKSSDAVSQLWQVGDLAVVVGTNDRIEFEEGSERRGVVLVFPHEKYVATRAREVYYDTALLMVSHAVALTKMIQLNRIVERKNQPPAYGTLCTVIGWGIIEPVLPGESTSKKKSARYLQKVDVIIGECSESGYYQHICTIANGKDPCMGDSGGPLLVNGIQIASVSFGFGCAQMDTAYYYALDSEWVTDAAERAMRGVGYHVTGGYPFLLTMACLRVGSSFLDL